MTQPVSPEDALKACQIARIYHSDGTGEFYGPEATRSDPPKAVLDEEVVALRGLLVECQDRFRYLDQGVWVALIDDELTRLKDCGTD